MFIRSASLLGLKSCSKIFNPSALTSHDKLTKQESQIHASLSNLGLTWSSRHFFKTNATRCQPARTYVLIRRDLRYMKEHSKDRKPSCDVPAWSWTLALHEYGIRRRIFFTGKNDVIVYDDRSCNARGRAASASKSPPALN